MGKPPVFQVPTMSAANVWDDRDNDSNFSRESAVPNISPPVNKRNPGNMRKGPTSDMNKFETDSQTIVPNNRKGNEIKAQQNKSNNVGSLLQWDEQPIGGPPPKRQQQNQNRNPSENIFGGSSTPQDNQNAVAFPSRKQ